MLAQSKELAINFGNVTNNKILNHCSNSLYAKIQKLMIDLNLLTLAGTKNNLYSAQKHQLQVIRDANCKAFFNKL